jgi:hypothetical protein
MAKSDLLKQAIADANAVKETALANAKIALQEAFRPRLESMFADKLSEELDDEELAELMETFSTMKYRSDKEAKLSLDKTEQKNTNYLSFSYNINGNW